MTDSSRRRDGAHDAADAADGRRRAASPGSTPAGAAGRHARPAIGDRTSAALRRSSAPSLALAQGRQPGRMYQAMWTRRSATPTASARCSTGGAVHPRRAGRGRPRPGRPGQHRRRGPDRDRRHRRRRRRAGARRPRPTGRRRCSLMALAAAVGGAPGRRSPRMLQARRQRQRGDLDAAAQLRRAPTCSPTWSTARGRTRRATASPPSRPLATPTTTLPRASAATEPTSASSSPLVAAVVVWFAAEAHARGASRCGCVGGNPEAARRAGLRGRPVAARGDAGRRRAGRPRRDGPVRRARGPAAARACCDGFGYIGLPRQLAGPAPAAARCRSPRCCSRDRRRRHGLQIGSDLPGGTVNILMALVLLADASRCGRRPAQGERHELRPSRPHRRRRSAARRSSTPRSARPISERAGVINVGTEGSHARRRPRRLRRGRRDRQPVGRRARRGGRRRGARGGVRGHGRLPQGATSSRPGSSSCSSRSASPSLYGASLRQRQRRTAFSDWKHPRARLAARSSARCCSTTTPSSTSRGSSPRARGGSSSAAAGVC